MDFLVFPTLDAPLKEGLAALTGPHPVVVPGGVVAAHGAEARVFGHLEPPGPGSGAQLPHAARLLPGAALLLPGGSLVAGSATGYES